MNSFTQTLQGKLLLTLVAGLTLLAVVALFSLSTLNRSIDGFEALREGESHTRTQTNAIHLAFKTQVQEWKNVLLRGNETASRDKYWKRFMEQDQSVKVLTSQLMSTLGDGDAKRELQRFESAHAALLVKYQRGLDAFVGAGFDPRVGDKEVQGIDRASSKLLSGLSGAIADEEAALVEAFTAGGGQTVAVAIGSFVGVSILVLLGMNFALRSQFITPLREVVDDLKRVSNGDFSHKLTQTATGEIGELNESLTKMKHDLGTMMQSIRATSDVLKEVSKEFRVSSDGITSDTSKAESFSTQIADAISQMASTVTEVASNAANAADATQVADKSANEGLATMEGAIRAIANVASNVSSISDDMAKLEQDTTSVGAVLDVIKGIAEQTNLLALNAAIEAARAGEQGRGFAVVADEVRALAKRTQESTEEIQHIIETVQTGAASAAQAMQSGNEKAEDAAKLAQGAGGAIETIAQSIGKIRDMNNQIAAAAEEQSVAADEISRNVVNMSSLARNAHTSASSTRGTTSKLEQAATELVSIVARFRI